MEIKYEFNQEDIKAFEPENKIGLLATVNEKNQAHITLITTLQAKNSKELIWGQFSEGFSKVNIKNNPKTAFLIMNLQLLVRKTSRYLCYLNQTILMKE